MPPVARTGTFGDDMYVFCKMNPNCLSAEGGGATLKVTGLKVFTDKPKHIDLIQLIDFSKDIDTRKEEKEAFYKWNMWNHFYCNLNTYLLLKIKSPLNLVITEEIFVESRGDVC